MGFNEMTHAFLAARYYIRLTEQFGDRGREAFIHGIQYYGSQRGRRMAQGAIRDGKPLTYENYCRYGEWVNTEEIKAMGAANRVEIGGYDPDYIMNIYSCPWFAQFQKMGAGEAGKAYCSLMDPSISLGFNPDRPERRAHSGNEDRKIYARSKILRVPLRPYLLVPERGFRRDLRGRRRKGQRRSLRGLCKRIQPGDGGYHCRL